MTEKRFTVAVYDENAINGFTVLDLEKPNSSKRLKYENVYIGSKVGCKIVCNFGNSLAEENEQLKQQKEVWKQICCTNSNFNSILLHELDIAQEQGYEVSNPFKQFLEDKGDEE